MKTSEQLKAAKQLILTLEKWGQGKFSQGDPERICASEAIRRVFKTDAEKYVSDGAYLFGPAYSIFCRANQITDKVSSFNCSVSAFNDSHTHEEVLTAFDRAITLAELEGDK